ncbi:hypothetical protein BDW22DRAFT_1358331 [Trametopsis cervina]|nr:hypothetical protein BDW22DRAFT_1358331 [Trametopsis cervina]
MEWFHIGADGYINGFSFETTGSGVKGVLLIAALAWSAALMGLARNGANRIS